MRQVIQNYRTGAIELAEVPVPACGADKVLVQNMASLISIGTERAIIDLGRKSLLGKAKARPDLVKRFMDKAKKEGLMKTFKEAMGRLDNPVALGYSSAGVVLEVGKNVHGFSPGDRVACIGAGYASHAEYIVVPEILCCKMTDELTFHEASFGMLGIIALHGIRCGNLMFGESVAVIGLGLLGLLTMQILRSYGCSVIGMDIDAGRVEFAKQIGFENVFISTEDFKDCIDKLTGGYGVDAVIITASTNSDDPIHIAVDAVRHRGRIVVTGTADIHPNRNEMWHKEVEIVVSKGGGPGTLDPFYEIKGVDYPIGHVRWTEGRNLSEFLRLIATKKADAGALVSHKFSIEHAEDVYKNLTDNKGGTYIGVVFEYPQTTAEEKNRENIVFLPRRLSKDIGMDGKASLGVIGAGLFAKALLLPALRDIKNVRLHTLSTSTGANSYHIGKKYGFEKCTTDYRLVLEDREINAVLILTPHSAHAKMVSEALQAGKHVFVEKPLCINEDELDEIRNIYSSFKATQPPILMVGYNRRFSPHSRKIKEFLAKRKDPLVIHYRINPGYVPSEHWVHSAEEGGSRVIGEICHFIDFMQYLIECQPIKVYAERVSGNNKTILNSDNLSISLKFEDGSIGNIVYTASGEKAFSREYVEIFYEGNTITLNDFRETRLYRNRKSAGFKTSNQELGYKEELSDFFEAVRGKSRYLLSTDEMFVSTLSTFKINDSLRTGTPQYIKF